MQPCKLFDTYPAFLDFVNTSKPVNYGSSWSGGTYKDALRDATIGNADLARQADKTFANVEDMLLPSVEIEETEAYYYGSRPNISAVITGRPKSMYRRQHVSSSDNRGPIRLYLDRACSSAFTNEQIMKRGIAILGLILAIKRVRPVTFYVGGTNDYRGAQTVWAVALDINNIDMSVLANAVASTTFYRCLGFSIIETVNPHIPSGIPKGDVVRKLLGWSENDIIFDGLHLHDADVSLALSDPMGWARSRFNSINKTSAE